MLKYDTHSLLKNNQSYYALVVAVAKRARAIAEKAEANKEIIEGKPVKMAIDELMSGNFTVIESPISPETPAKKSEAK